MYLIFPAADVVEESYLALVAQEKEVPPPTGLTSVHNTELCAPSIYHDTTEEQLRAEGYLQGDFFEAAEAYRGLPDLVPAHALKARNAFKHQDYPGRVETTLIMSSGNGAGGTMAADLGISVVGIGSGMRVSIRDLIHPNLNDPLKSQQQVTFKLVKTVSDFSHALSKIHEQYADDLQSLVDDFRRKNTDLRNERPNCTNSMFTVWDSLLQETELDASVHTDIAGVLSRSVSRPLLEKTFHMKIQSRKVFTNRESYENLLAKTEDMLVKSHNDYSMAFELHGSQKSPMSTSNLIESHNNYVQQLHAANGMIDQYYSDALPDLLQELDYVYHDVSAVMTESLMQGADMIAMKTAETARRYDSFRRRVKEINPVTDLNAFIKSLVIPDTVTITTHMFAPPQVRDPSQLDGLPPLRDELVVDRSSQNIARNRFDSLRKESQDLELQIRQLSDALETLVRIQAKSLESQLFNKANEVQEDISGKRFDQKLAQIHLAAVRAQKDMFASKVDSGMGVGVGGNGAPSGAADFSRERKLSNTSSQGSMKNKWVKAFKSIKGGKEAPVEPRQRNGKDNGAVLPQAMSENAHIFQEYTYKKITPCDICSQILRGHTRQGLKCKLCRMNIHPDCQDPSLKCQPKSRLLRRQKSASEIEARYFGGGDQTDNDRYGREEGQPVYPIGVIARGPMGSGAAPPGSSAPSSGGGPANVVEPDPYPPRFEAAARSGSAPYRRAPVTAGTVAGGATGAPDRYGYGTNTLSIGPTNIASSSAPSSPVHNRRMLTARNARMSSVELPDENEKSVSSASTSPCHSPKPHRLLPTNLFVVLYNFKPRHSDELELKAGYKLTVIDNTDKDWWKGKCVGSIGVFPSTYVTKLQSGEKPLQVIQSVTINSAIGDGPIQLLRDQIVIQVDELRDGLLLVRTSDHRQGACSVEYLTEV